MQRVVELLHATPTKFCIVVTGGGASVISSLTGVAGCSRTLLNAVVPYATTALVRLIDDYPAKFVTQDVSLLMAQSAYHDALKLTASEGEAGIPVVGIGATSAIATDRTRHGANHGYVTAWSANSVCSYYVSIDRPESTRAEQDIAVASTILKAMAIAAQVVIPEDIVFPCDAERLTTATFDPNVDVLSRVLHGELPAVTFNAFGVPRVNLPPFTASSTETTKALYLLYPGSFAPLHWGHTELAHAAAKVARSRDATQRPVVITFEVSASIVGKQDVSITDMQRRVAQFSEKGLRIAVTNRKLFIEKARLFPHHAFVIGSDTAIRVIDPVYYNNDRAQMIDAMLQIGALGCYFIVGGRNTADKGFVDLGSLSIPEEIAHLFVPIPQHMFQVDISSTELRARKPDAS